MNKTTVAQQAKTASFLPPVQGILQRKCACGNHTFAGGECLECAKKKTGLQQKLSIGANNDPLEREADRVADQVLATPAHSAVNVASLRIQRFSGQSARQSEEVPASVDQALASSGRPLEPTLQQDMEQRFGHDFSRVRVHSGTAAEQSARDLSAHAYTVGRDIVFAAGQFAPGAHEGRRLLAHELTHVLQQTAMPGTEVSHERAKVEAERNSRRVFTGMTSEPVSALAPTGTIQRQDKPKDSVSGERTGTKEGKNKFGFKAEVTVPLTPDLKFGSVSFLDDLKLTGSGGVTEGALGASSAELDDIKLQLALTMAKLELATTKDKAEELRRGKLNLGATLNTTGTQTFAFDPLAPKSSLGASLTLKAANVTPSLLPSKGGELTIISPSISATGSVTQELGGEGKVTPKAEGKVGLEATFKSPPSAILALGGALGNEAQVTAGLEASASGSITPEKTSGKLTAGGSVGLAGKDKNIERFVKIQLTGEIGIDRGAGRATATTKSVFLGVTTGFKF